MGMRRGLHGPELLRRDVPDSSGGPVGFRVESVREPEVRPHDGLSPDRRYHSAFEPGCSMGVLSALLSGRCDRLLATDIVASVVERAGERCRIFPGVRVEERAIPEAWPEGPFDLVVLSEIAYYFDAEALADVMARMVGSTLPGATVVAVHWSGETNYPLSGDAAHRILAEDPCLEPFVHHLEPEFVLDVWRTHS